MGVAAEPLRLVRPTRIVQTFTWEAMPEGVSLERLVFEELGDGWARLHAQSLVESFEARDGWLNSGMEVGVNDGYAEAGRVTPPARACEALGA